MSFRRARRPHGVQDHAHRDARWRAPCRGRRPARARQRRVRGPVHAQGARRGRPVRAQPRGAHRRRATRAASRCRSPTCSRRPGTRRRELRTTAHVRLEQQPPRASRSPASQLSNEGEVPGVDDAEFQQLAERAKTTCPVSLALAGTEITLVDAAGRTVTVMAGASSADAGRAGASGDTVDGARRSVRTSAAPCSSRRARARARQFRAAQQRASARRCSSCCRAAGACDLDGAEHALEPESGAYLAPGETYELRNSGDEPLRLVAVSIPDPAPPDGAAARARSCAGSPTRTPGRPTAEREFRIVADPASGLRSATHFVGYIPTARAPDHYAPLRRGASTSSTARARCTSNGETTAAARRAPASTFAARTVHCLENLGADAMKVARGVSPGGLAGRRVLPRRHACSGRMSPTLRRGDT